MPTATRTRPTPRTGTRVNATTRTGTRTTATTRTRPATTDRPATRTAPRTPARQTPARQTPRPATRTPARRTPAATRFDLGEEQFRGRGQMKVEMVPLASLHRAPWNPPERSDPTNAYIKQLATSAVEFGIRSPIQITSEDMIFEGHCRAAAAELAGLTTIPAIRSNLTDEQVAAIYGEMNDNQRKLSGNQILGVYLENPMALAGRQRAKAAQIERVCGRTLMSALYKAGLSPATFGLSTRVVGACNGAVTPKQVVSWFIKCRPGHALRTVLDSQNFSAAKVVRAIKNNRPLSLDVVLTD